MAEVSLTRMPALKEWAATIQALENGDQIMTTIFNGKIMLIKQSLFFSI